MMEYKEYMDSGSTWMGKIPTKWQTCLLKYMFSIEKRIVGEEGHTVLSITQSGIKPKKWMARGNLLRTTQNIN